MSAAMRLAEEIERVAKTKIKMALLDIITSMIIVGVVGLALWLWRRVRG